MFHFLFTQSISRIVYEREVRQYIILTLLIFTIQNLRINEIYNLWLYFCIYDIILVLEYTAVSSIRILIHNNFLALSEKGKVGKEQELELVFYDQILPIQVISFCFCLFVFFLFSFFKILA